ncbi:MAG TPA: HlyD family efflux transporter periplasmic adaptor subunit [Candidatus Limnocylindrales bacterium]
MRLRLIGTLLLIVVGVGAVVAVVAQPGSGSTAATRYTTATAQVTDVTKSVVATGTVGPVAVYSLQFGSNATLQNSSSNASSNSNSNSGSGNSPTWKVATLNATPGQAVKAGDVLATADTSSAELALTVAQANLASAQARLKTDQQGLSATDRAAAALQVTQANQALSQAQTARSQTYAQNSLKLSQQLQAVADAKSKYATDKAASPPVPAAQLTQDQSAITAAQQQLASLRLQIAQSNQQATNQVTSASNQVTSAKLAYASKIAGPNGATIASDQAAIATAQQNVDTAKSSLGFAQLVSPVDGVILTVNITQGVDASSGSAITVQSNAFQVSASVAEADLPSLKLGQDANVTLTASGLAATGKVTQITPVGSGGSSGGVVTYPILVSLPQPPAGTASGMSASISIVTAQASNVLAVPSIALVGSATTGYNVRVLDSANQPQLVSVQVGLVTSSLAEIQSGISQGAVVVTGTSASRTTTNATQGGGFGGGGLGVPGGGQFRQGGG